MPTAIIIWKITHDRPLSLPDNESNRGDSNPPLVLVEFFSWWCWFGSTEDRRLVVKIVLGVRAKTHGLEVPVDHIDLALRNEEIFDKLRRCDILLVVRMIDLIRAGVFSNLHLCQPTIRRPASPIASHPLLPHPRMADGRLLERCNDPDTKHINSGSEVIISPGIR